MQRTATNNKPATTSSSLNQQYSGFFSTHLFGSSSSWIPSLSITPAIIFKSYQYYSEAPGALLSLSVVSSSWVVIVPNRIHRNLSRGLPDPVVSSSRIRKQHFLFAGAVICHYPESYRLCPECFLINAYHIMSYIASTLTLLALLSSTQVFFMFDRFD